MAICLNKPVREVDVYPIDELRGIWSFAEEPAVSPVRVRVPAGTIPRLVVGLGIELSVPTGDKLVRKMWSANEVMREVLSGSRRFRLVNAKYQGRLQSCIRKTG